MTLRADIAALDEDVRRVGSERAKTVWARLRPILEAMERLYGLYSRSEDETRETQVPR